MKRIYLYIIIAVSFFLFALYIISQNTTRKKVMDERVTLKAKDKIPYGTYAARYLLPSLFDGASVVTEHAAPGEWSLSAQDSGQAVILICNSFSASNEELEHMLQFCMNGNYLFILTKEMYYNVRRQLQLHQSVLIEEDQMLSRFDSWALQLSPPRFQTNKVYQYPGKRFSAFFKEVDTVQRAVLGTTQEGFPNFIQMQVGQGAVFIHTAPLAFSNYFLLHKDNISYIENALSVIPSHVKKLVWNEYYLTRQQASPQQPNWLGVLMKYDSLRWALLTAMAILLIYGLLEMRRRQRIVPAFNVFSNDSLDFIKTIGRLYYNQQDHKDLANKMILYFQDHLRTRYKIATFDLNDHFVDTVNQKTGYSRQGVSALVNNVIHIQMKDSITEKELTQLYKQIEDFYQNT